MRLSTPLAAFLAVALLAPCLAHAEGPRGWMTPGAEVEYVGTGVRATGPAEEPADWLGYRAVVAAVNDTAVTFSVQAYDVDGILLGLRAYDLSTRKSLDGTGSAVLWINEEDVRNGIAQIGDRWATLVLSTPAFHQFTDGGASYSYSVDTGLLLYAENLDTGAFAARQREP